MGKLTVTDATSTDVKVRAIVETDDFGHVRIEVDVPPTEFDFDDYIETATGQAKEIIEREFDVVEILEIE